MHAQRPKGVTLIGILDIVGGLFILIGGIGLFVILPTIASNPDQFSIDSNSLEFKLLTSMLGYVLAGGLVALGIADIVIGIGLLKGKQWAWKIAVICSFISIAIDIVLIVVNIKSSNPASSIVSAIINVIILYYLYRPHVRAYFRKPAEQTSL